MDSDVTCCKFVPISVPLCWIRTYHKLLELLSCYANHKLNNKHCNCAGTSDKILECYDLFLGAIANYKLNRFDAADEIIKYIDCILSVYETSEEFTITLDSKTYFVTPTEITLIDDTPVTVTRPVLCGFVDFDTLEDYDSEDYITRHLTDDVIQTFMIVTDRNVSLPITIPTNSCRKLFVVLVPEAENIKVYKDDGFGNKVSFGGSYWKSNGDTLITAKNSVYKVHITSNKALADGEVTITVNDAKYKVYGQTYTTYGNIKIYID